MKMTKEKSDRIIRGLKRYYPDVRPDLKYRNLYQLSVAVVLSAQTTDRQVNGVTGELFGKYPDFARLAAARLTDVERIIHSTGFFRTKARNIIGLAKAVTAEHGGRLPSTREELVRLPGIGRKSANVILSMGFDTPALAVDTHIIRIAGRLAYTDSRDPLAVERALTAFIPERQWKLAHLLLIRHGRTLCTARRPQCDACPVRTSCAYAGSTR